MIEGFIWVFFIHFFFLMRSSILFFWCAALSIFLMRSSGFFFLFLDAWSFSHFWMCGLVLCCCSIDARSMLSRLVGCLKIYVSFTKEPYKRDLYSAKETYILKHPANRSHPIVSRSMCSLICFSTNARSTLSLAFYRQEPPIQNALISVKRERERERERERVRDLVF